MKTWARSDRSFQSLAYLAPMPTAASPPIPVKKLRRFMSGISR